MIPFEYMMPTADTECMFLSFFLITISVLWIGKQKQVPIYFYYLYLSLLTFGTNDANVWEHGAAMNLSLSFEFLSAAIFDSNVQAFLDFRGFDLRNF